MKAETVAFFMAETETSTSLVCGEKQESQHEAVSFVEDEDATSFENAMDQRKIQMVADMLQMQKIVFEALELKDATELAKKNSQLEKGCQTMFEDMEKILEWKQIRDLTEGLKRA